MIIVHLKSYGNVGKSAEHSEQKALWHGKKHSGEQIQVQWIKNQHKDFHIWFITGQDYACIYFQNIINNKYRLFKE